MLPLIFTEAMSKKMADLAREDARIAVWWGTWAECAVAISRLRRGGFLTEESEHDTRTVLDDLASDWVEIDPEDDLRLLASLLSKEHPLKAADALQLAAALRWCKEDSGGAGFVRLDNRLRQAAQADDFGILPEILDTI